MLCNYCWKEKDVEEFSPTEDDLCVDCHRKLTQPTLSDEVGASYGQIRWLVSEINKKNQLISALQAENTELKSDRLSQSDV